MTDFDLDEFLKTYKPAKVDLRPYLKLDKLKGYKFVNKGERSVLISNQTYVKYVSMSDAFKDDDLEMHVGGGVLRAGGIFVNGKFMKTESVEKWTHLLLEFSPYPTGRVRTKHGHKNVYEYDRHLFYIKMTSYYLFYKYF
jgi:hypothetical protein